MYKWYKRIPHLLLNATDSHSPRFQPWPMFNTQLYLNGFIHFPL